MQRDTSRLQRHDYDLVIVGAGIYGICAAWDAVQRGLSVALVDRGDFCAETSANPLKIVHGGFRYLQHADLPRIRQSTRERRVLMRIAPHLVSPLPFLIPTYGHGMQGREILGTALFVYDMLAFDRNRSIRDPQKKIPWGESVSLDECVRRFPGLRRDGLTGGIVFYDAQMYSPPRLALSYLKSAVGAGVEAANYVEMTDFLKSGDRVVGIKARDVLSGSEIEIGARVVLNATGPWTESIVGKLGLRLPSPLQVTKDVYLVVDRVFDSTYALAAPSRYRDPDAILSRGTRHFFLIPWRGHTLVGSSHVIYEGPPDEFRVTDDDLDQLVAEINDSYSAGIHREEVSTWNSGMVPYGDYYGKRSRIVDHGREDDVAGLVSVVGVRWTTSRGVAAKAIDLVGRKLGRSLPRSTSEETPVHGGAIDRFDEFLSEALSRCAALLGEATVRALVHNHGTAYTELVARVEQDRRLGETLADSHVVKAEIVHAVREEMAQNLGDVVFRRTDLGTAGRPSEATLRACASEVAGLLNWDATRIGREISGVSRVFTP